MRVWLGSLLAVLAVGGAPTRADITKLSDEPLPSVGVVATLNDLVLPGTELEPKPLVDRQSRVVVRVVDVFRHGDRFRYNLSYYGLEPGAADLRDYLQRRDRSSTADLPPIPVAFRSSLTKPGQIEPNRPVATPSGFRSYYRALMFLGAVLWLVGLALILFVGRRRPDTRTPSAERPVTLADRLRPLVAQARSGTLPPGERAELERGLIEYWRRRLGLTDLAPGVAIARIKADPTAGVLLRHLESWLHRPPGEDAPVDLDALLAPYQEAVDAATPAPLAPAREVQPAS